MVPSALGLAWVYLMIANTSEYLGFDSEAASKCPVSHVTRELSQIRWARSVSRLIHEESRQDRHDCRSTTTSSISIVQQVWDMMHEALKPRGAEALTAERECCRELDFTVSNYDLLVGPLELPLNSSRRWCPVKSESFF